ncbi:MAG TPA: RHS repeat-associated core domain-containing protein, partial [Rhodanobacter sp.]|nr:RHS repeat-associated core domain-containing protein [Rhodanobacter sp.]
LTCGALHAQVTYIYTDPQGTPLAEADAHGNITARFDYAPYGTAVTNSGMSGAPNGPGYIGQVNDPDTGLVYLQHRYLDPNTGRFISADPMGPAPGDVFNFNRFDYGNNNPIMNTDPDGRCPWCMVGTAAAGAVIGGGIDIVVQKHYHPGQPLDKAQIGIAAAGGAFAAVGGALMTAAAVEGSLTVGQVVLRQAALNGAVGAAQSMAGDVSHGRPISNQAAVNAAGANIIGSFVGSGISSSFSAFAGASENHALGMMLQAPVNSPAGIGGTIANTTLAAGSTAAAPSMMQAAFSQTSHVGDVMGAVGTEKLNPNN